MVSAELEEAAFDYTDGRDLSFSQSVANGIEKEIVIDYLNDIFPDRSFTDEEVKEVTDLIIVCAKDHIEFLIREETKDFEKELDGLTDYYENERCLPPLTICKILIEKASYLFPNV